MVNPIDYYAKSKWQSERAIQYLNHAPTILRFGTLFGISPRLRFDLVVNVFIIQALFEGKITVNGGEQYRPFLSLNDVTNVYKFILYKDKKLGSFICNLVSFNLKIKTLAQKILKIINNKNTRIIFNPQNKDKRNYIVGSKNFDKIFGKNFKFSSFKTEVKYLFKQMKANKIKLNSSTIRMKYYKKIL